MKEKQVCESQFRAYFVFNERENEICREKYAWILFDSFIRNKIDLIYNGTSSMLFLSQYFIEKIDRI